MTSGALLQSIMCLQMFDHQSDFGSGPCATGSLGQSLYGTLRRQEVGPDSWCRQRDWCTGKQQTGKVSRDPGWVRMSQGVSTGAQWRKCLVMETVFKRLKCVLRQDEELQLKEKFQTAQLKRLLGSGLRFWFWVTFCECAFGLKMFFYY